MLTLIILFNFRQLTSRRVKTAHTTPSTFGESPYLNLTFPCWMMVLGQIPRQRNTQKSVTHVQMPWRVEDKKLTIPNTYVYLFDPFSQSMDMVKTGSDTLKPKHRGKFILPVKFLVLLT